MYIYLLFVIFFFKVKNMFQKGTHKKAQFDPFKFKIGLVEDQKIKLSNIV